MKVVSQSYEFIKEVNPLKKIELCGRVCYKSEGKITDDSAERFIKMLINRGHESVLEHHNIIFSVTKFVYEDTKKLRDFLEETCGETIYLRFTDRLHNGEPRYFISGNVRAFRDFARQVCIKHDYYTPIIYSVAAAYPLLFEDVVNDKSLKYSLTPVIVEIPNENISFTNGFDPVEVLTHRCETVRFICDRGISHEIVRHRPASYSQESTRYVDYKNRGMEVIEPSFYEEDANPAYNVIWDSAMRCAEALYQKLLEYGSVPQEARSVLPNSLKTELIMTANLNEWNHFFEVRTPKDVHPQMRELSIPLFKAFQEKFPIIFDNISI